MTHFLVAYGLRGHLAERIDPAVSYSVTELFFLSPGYALGQLVGKGFADNLFLDGLSRTHLRFGIETHCYIQEFLVEERNTALHTPCGQ